MERAEEFSKAHAARKEKQAAAAEKAAAEQAAAEKAAAEKQAAEKAAVEMAALEKATAEKAAHQWEAEKAKMIEHAACTLRDSNLHMYRALDTFLWVRGNLTGALGRFDSCPDQVKDLKERLAQAERKAKESEETLAQARIAVAFEQDKVVHLERMLEEKNATLDAHGIITPVGTRPNSIHLRLTDARRLTDVHG